MSHYSISTAEALYESDRETSAGVASAAELISSTGALAQFQSYTAVPQQIESQLPIDPLFGSEPDLAEGKDVAVFLRAAVSAGVRGEPTL